MNSFKSLFISLVCSGLFLLNACLPLPDLLSQIQEQQPAEVREVQPAYTPQPLPTIGENDLQERLVALYEYINPGVVSIHTYINLGGGGQGSGFVYDTLGHIVTNYHVVEDAEEIEVAFSDGFRAMASLVGRDLNSDIAVLKVKAAVNQFKPLPLGDLNSVKVGQTVVAIGNPFGLSGTMTVGIISSLGRTLESMQSAPGGGLFTSGDLIQTDAAINPGNSGGPLLNLNGEVIGINRAIRTDEDASLYSPVNSGIGFAVPVDIVRKVVPELIKYGTYDYPYMGIESYRGDFTLKVLDALNMPANTVGAYVMGVNLGGPADQAGLQGGDRQTNIENLIAGGDWIIAIDDSPISTFNDMLSYIVGNTRPGDTVMLTILREGRQLELPLTLGKR
jgi:2-alkenal reductase